MGWDGMELGGKDASLHSSSPRIGFEGVYRLLGCPLPAILAVCSLASFFLLLDDI